MRLLSTPAVTRKLPVLALTVLFFAASAGADALQAGSPHRRASGRTLPAHVTVTPTHVAEPIHPAGHGDLGHPTHIAAPLPSPTAAATATSLPRRLARRHAARRRPPAPKSPPRSVPVRDTGTLAAPDTLTPHSVRGLLGVGSYIAQRARGGARTLVKRVKRLGATWVREEITATELHNSTAAPYDWKPYDRVIDAERRAGLHVLGLLDYSNTWGDGDHGTMPHAAIDQLARDFAGFAYAAASHYRGRIRYWEVWNEPNIATFWRPTPDAADYAILLQAAYHAIKRANPDARVVIAGTSGVDLHFLHAVAAATDAYDVIAVHPYRATPEPQLLDQVAALRSFGKPIWFTEIGWPAGAPCLHCTTVADQADYLVRFYALAAAAGVQRIFWYDLRDDLHGAAPAETHFGLLRRDASGKQAARAYAFLARMLHQATFQSALSTGVDGVYALRFDRGALPLALLWNTGYSTQTVSVPWPTAGAVAVTDTGELLGAAPVVDGQASWRVSPGGQPVYLASTRPPAAPTFLAALTPTPRPTPRPTAALPHQSPGTTSTPQPTSTMPAATVSAPPTATTAPPPTSTPTLTASPVPTATETPTVTATPAPTSTTAATPPSTTPVPTTQPRPTTVGPPSPTTTPTPMPSATSTVPPPSRPAPSPTVEPVTPTPATTPSPAS